MRKQLDDTEIREIQQKYSHLINYESDDIDFPISPARYVDSNGDHLLHIAARIGDLRTVDLLINAGMDVNLVGDMGCTALHYAKLKKHPEVAEFLISNGAITGIRNEFGESS
jgi:ankyrin repeat protein